MNGPIHTRPWLRALRENWLLLIVLAGFGAALVFLRTPATRLPSLAALDAELADGTPKLVEFYSDF